MIESHGTHEIRQTYQYNEDGCIQCSWLKGINCEDCPTYNCWIQLMLLLSSMKRYSHFNLTSHTTLPRGNDCEPKYHFLCPTLNEHIGILILMISFCKLFNVTFPQVINPPLRKWWQMRSLNLRFDMPSFYFFSGLFYTTGPFEMRMWIPNSLYQFTLKNPLSH